MGTYHFMGVGRSVGAVTCAVDYIERLLEKIKEGKASERTLKLFSSSGGINHEEKDKGKIEALVLFTSKEVIEYSINAYAYDGNENPDSVRSELEIILRNIWKTYDRDLGRRIFWCEVDIDNYQDCFEKIIKVTYRLSHPKKQGKEIWCNFTSGSDSIGLALLNMSELTAKSTKRYLLTQRKDYRSHIRVPQGIAIEPNQDEYFVMTPFVKKAIDAFKFYEILTELDSINGSLSPDELYSRMMGKSQFQDLTDQKLFERLYLIRLYSLGYTEISMNQQKEIESMEITQDGRRFLHEELEELQRLIDFENILQQSADNLIEESRSWGWFHEVNLEEKTGHSSA